MTGATTSFSLHGGRAATEHEAAVWRVYDDVFHDFEDEGTFREQMWDRHRERSGFRLATAYDGGSLLGFGWCYVGERGQFWSDWVVRELPRETTDAWVGGHLEVVSLAVLPSARGRGVGSRLLDLMLAGRGGRRVLLATSADDSDPAVRLYESRGFVTLGRLSDDVRVMGLLPRE